MRGLFRLACGLRVARAWAHAFVRRDPVPLTMLLFFAGPSAAEPGCRHSGMDVRA